MFLPIGDTPNPERFTPFVTWGLMAVNIAIYFSICVPLSSQLPETSNPLLLEYARMLASRGFTMNQIQVILSQTTMNDLLLFTYGYTPANPSIANIFTSMFLHGSFMHLAGNMLFLYIYGDNVEHHLGRMKFLAMYLGTGVIATLSFALFTSSSFTPLVGASGAISGVLGFYFFMFPRNKVKVLIVLFPIYFGVIRIPARIVLGIFVIIDNLLPVLIQAGGSVAYGAHLGGFFGGLGLAVMGSSLEWRLPLKKVMRNGMGAWAEGGTAGDSSRDDKTSHFQRSLTPPEVGTVLRALQNNDIGVLKNLSPEEFILSARSLEKHSLYQPAAKLLKVAIVCYKKSPHISEIYYELGRIRLREGFPTAAYQHLLTALDLSASPKTEENIRKLLKEIKT